MPSVARLAGWRGLGQTLRMNRLPLLAVLLVLVLSGCGFHLRDALVLPENIDRIKVESRDPYSALVSSLERSIARAGAAVVAADGSAEARSAATLRISSERWASTPLSVDQFGRAQEYTLRYAVVFSLLSAEGDVVVPQQAVEMSRDYISSPTESTGTDTERELLTREMQREMTASILRRIDATVRGRPH